MFCWLARRWNCGAGPGSTGSVGSWVMGNDNAVALDGWNTARAGGRLDRTVGSKRKSVRAKTPSAPVLQMTFGCATWIPETLSVWASTVCTGMYGSASAQHEYVCFSELPSRGRVEVTSPDWRRSPAGLSIHLTWRTAAGVCKTRSGDVAPLSRSAGVAPSVRMFQICTRWSWPPVAR